MPKQLRHWCLCCTRLQGCRAATIDRHLNACVLKAAADGAVPAAGGGGGASAGAAAPADSGAGPTGSVVASSFPCSPDRVLVLRATSFKIYSMTIVARPMATVRDLHRLLLHCWMDCGCGHLWSLRSTGGRLLHPRRQLGSALLAEGDVLGYSYDMGDSSSARIEACQLDARLSAAGATWMGDRLLAVAVRNEHPSATKARCECGGLARYWGGGGATFCSKRCLEEAEAWMQEGNEHEDDEDEAEAPGAEEGAVADEDDQLWRRRIWNSPRMGACGYCGPDAFTPRAFFEEGGEAVPARRGEYPEEGGYESDPGVEPGGDAFWWGNGLAGCDDGVGDGMDADEEGGEEGEEGAFWDEEDEEDGEMGSDEECCIM